MTHIDDWIDRPSYKNPGEVYAKFVFWYFRYPAWAQAAFAPWMSQYKLFCTYKGDRYRCTGASRLGDIWLTRDFERDTGYELRVDVAECSEWGDSPASVLDELSALSEELGGYEPANGQPDFKQS